MKQHRFEIKEIREENQKQNKDKVTEAKLKKAESKEK